MGKKKPFWTSLPGILTGVGGLIGAVAALVTALNSVGLFNGEPEVNGATEIKTKQLLLKHPDKSWGEVIESAWGRLIYDDNEVGVFAGRLYLKGLTADHEYVLSLNGKPEHQSNKWLPKQHGSERYADILTVTTDSEGNLFSEPIKYALTPGVYDVKIFIKDPEEDWKPVLFYDPLTFSVGGG
ncbi:MAG: hypothetical protein ACE5ER_07210 [Nitrospinaceae bacterium]